MCLLCNPLNLVACPNGSVASLHASVAVTYAASIVVNATQHCTLGIQETAPLMKVNTYPEVDFLQSA